MIPSNLTRAPVSAEETQSQSTKLPPPYFKQSVLWIISCLVFALNIPFRILPQSLPDIPVAPYFNVAGDLFSAFLIIFLLVHSSILEGHPVLGDVTVMCQFLHLLIPSFGNSCVPLFWWISFNIDIPSILCKCFAVQIRITIITRG